MIEKVNFVILLKDFYGPLLTKRQQDILKLHYEDDWSLTEIADDMNISRQAVYDIVKRAESLLKKYEEKLGLVQKFQHTRQQLLDVADLLENHQQESVTEAIQVIKMISDLL